MLRKKLLSCTAGACALLGASIPAVADNGPKVTWHWHMHQPIYWNDQLAGAARYEYAWESIQAKRAGRANPLNDLDEIFGKDDRVAGYQYRMADSLAIIGSSDPNSGASISYSGALLENVRSLGQNSALGYSPAWKNRYQQAIGWTTTGGRKRFDFTNFSFHHGLLALLDPEVAYMELRLTQEILRNEFGPGVISDGFFPTEMCFSRRLIPVMDRLNIKWAIVSGEHIARATPDFPLVLGSGGVNCDPPNKADQINPPGVDFIRVSIDRGCSPVHANPLSYQPAYAKWVNPETGEEKKIIVVPADMSQGWRDGYSCIDASFLDRLNERNNPAQPSLVVLSHDGDNAFGGGFSYYNECVPNLARSARDRGREVTAIPQYLAQYPPNPNNVIHVEDGGWVYADSDFGSPTFINWNYPLLDIQGNVDPVNGWHEKGRDMAIFTESLNRLLTAQQIAGKSPDFAQILNPTFSSHPIDRAWHFYLGSLDSGNVYFGPALDLEIKATLGANRVYDLVDPLLTNLASDQTPPTIWLPQRHPYNPGSINFGVQYRYRPVVSNGDFHVYTFISDVNPVQATLKYRIDADGTNPIADNANELFAGGQGVGEWVSIPMNERAFPLGDPYGNNPNIDFFVLPKRISRHYSAHVVGLRSVLVDYYVEAVDSRGNIAKSPIQHVYIGSGEGSGGGGTGSRATISPSPAVRGLEATITYDASGTNLAGAQQVYAHTGRNGWQNVLSPRPAMVPEGGNTWSYTFTVPNDANTLEFVFTTLPTGGTGQWDNNGGADWRFTTTGTPPTPSPTPTPSPIPSPSPTGPTPSATPSPSPSPSFSPSPSPSPTSVPNPFVMDGQFDVNACDVGGGLRVARQNGWLYMARTLDGQNDLFLHVSTDASARRTAPWAKAGQVAPWTYFLAAEGTNDFAGWFDAAENAISGNAAFASFRGTTILEGAIREDLFGSAPILHLVAASYGTDNGGALATQAPPAVIANGDIDANEYFALGSGLNPCALPTPSPTATGTTPTASATATATASPTPTAGPNPFVLDGSFDVAACDVGGGLRMARQNGWLYVAAPLSLPSDTFIHVSTNTGTSVPANWAKAGQVAPWRFFLAVEGTNEFAGWFDSAENSVQGNPGLLLFRGVNMVEGAVREDLLGAFTSISVAAGTYQTDNQGALLSQAPPSRDGNGNMDANEYFTVQAGGNPCATPTPSPSASPSASPSSSPSASATATQPSPTATATATVSPSASPTISTTATTTVPPSPTASANPTATATATQTSTASPTASVASPTASPTASTPGTPTATSALVSQAAVRNALMGRTQSSLALDANGDGVIDAGDLRSAPNP